MFKHVRVMITKYIRNLNFDGEKMHIDNNEGKISNCHLCVFLSLSFNFQVKYFFCITLITFGCSWVDILLNNSHIYIHTTVMCLWFIETLTSQSNTQSCKFGIISYTHVTTHISIEFTKSWSDTHTHTNSHRPYIHRICVLVCLFVVCFGLTCGDTKKKTYPNYMIHNGNENIFIYIAVRKFKTTVWFSYEIPLFIDISCYTKMYFDFFFLAKV